MQHLTFTETPSNQPLAFISGGKHDGKVLFFDDNATAASSSLPQDDFDFSPYLKAYKPRERVLINARLNKALLLGKEPEEDIVHIFNKAKAGSALGSKLELSDGGSMQVIPMTNIPRTVAYSFGQSGSGKTSWTYNYAKQYKKLHPKHPIYLFSHLESDDTLDKLKPTLKRVMINDTFADSGLKAVDFADSLCIFDDIDALPADLKRPVYQHLDDILQVGWHFKTSVCITAHLGSNYKDSRMILNKCHYITCFQGGSSPKAIKYVLETYGGLDKKDVSKLLKLPSRWITVKRTYPGAIVYQSGAFLTGSIE